MWIPDTPTTLIPQLMEGEGAERLTLLDRGKDLEMTTEAKDCPGLQEPKQQLRKTTGD